MFCVRRILSFIFIFILGLSAMSNSAYASIRHRSRRHVRKVSVHRIIRRHLPIMCDVRYIAIHHTEVSRSQRFCQLYSVNEFHRTRFDRRSTLGWYVGYNWFVDADGTLTQCRVAGEETAAQLWHNFDTESICLAGNFNRELPTPAQILTLRRWLKERPYLEIHFHKDFADRNCPGNLFTKEFLYSVVLENT